MRGSVVDCIEVNIDFFGAYFHQWNRFDRLCRCNYWIFFLTVVILLKCLLQVNTILRKESRNMRLNVKLYLSVYGMQLWNWLQWVNIILAVI